MFGHPCSCSHLYPKHQMGWAQFDRRGHVAGGLDAILAVCRAWQTILTVLALGMDKANPRVSATSPGMVFPYPPGIGFPHPSGDWVYASPWGLGFRIPYPRVCT